MKKNFLIHTFGCQMNVHDSEKMAGILTESGFNEAGGHESTDLIILNTCSIREKAEQKFFSELGRLKAAKKRKPSLKIAVAGCIAQQEGEDIFKRFPYVDYVFGPNNIGKLKGWIDSAITLNPELGTYNTANRQQAIDIADNPSYHTMGLPVKREEGGRAWVSIMYGCDNYCAYCVVPYTRGRERSRPVEDILHEVRTLSANGCKEVTLLGQNVNSYGKNLSDGADFSRLLYVIHEAEGIERVRFVTSHPKDLSPHLVTAMKVLPKLCEHIHLPLQAGSDSVLKMMNRGYTYNEYVEKIQMLRAAVPGIAITTDIITGFPGESEDDFNMTISALTDMEFDGIFAFKYSKRPGTAALQFPFHIEEDVKSDRLAKVIELQESITSGKNRRLIGETLEVLVEGASKTDRSRLTGRTRTNKIVNYCGDKEDIGRLVNIKILEAGQHSLFGEKI
ncbi:MAG: tRNA (N6-isopentenyl adenosine(37)-C2)-methylthiotransferase MiaB [Nitrospirae bacterium]|nr:tRNA (N6-isopentenyl adenosine(37)-C2)-methylthiotransferase MiaB [Nitrospirota bacterium]